MSEPGDVPPAILDRLSRICLALPETYEEDAWVGVRWRVRKRTIAHVLTVDPERRPAYARAVGATSHLVVMTFRAPDDEVGAFSVGEPPYFKADWGHNVVGLVFGPRTDWAEVAELLTESYRIMAPKKLAALLPDPAAG
ncbi:MmcQ/YjbR family DNA-binding protein [Asanoa sp. WMMD1127]|uniref:MmcQ/YjbR family DNA-binding protein n=1 Tax=Asanoa sp. WMMD1127 TaxID=3016107 RepID=UPI002417A122|nr:MmcQ/YjbR family DNA-binding protein [Asanoa sp. WMMD1127]MDG4822573.1 MmcQ/YjbR family DNA-binding protein [Asanoa sp. WMMD1127]